MDLADGGGDLLDVDGRVVPGQPVLLVAHDDGEQAGDGHLAADLRQAEHEQVRPAVPHQANLGLIPAAENAELDFIMGFKTKSRLISGLNGFHFWQINIFNPL